MVCLWDINTKIALKMVNCIIETVKKKGGAHNSLIAEVFPAKGICDFSFLEGWRLWDWGEEQS